MILDSIIHNRKKVIFAVIILFLIIFSSILYNPIKTINSLKNQDGLYEITYYGNYDRILGLLSDYAIKTSSKNPSINCSLFFTSSDQGNAIYGRNFDKYGKYSPLIGKYKPKDGYASIALTSPEWAGINLESNSIIEKIKCISVPLLVMDGMNEKGVVVATSANSKQTVNMDKNKKTGFFTFVSRQILDHAKNIEEAVAIAKKYNIVAGKGELLDHFLIADASGHSVILEQSQGELKVIKSSKAWQVLTNFPVYGVAEDTQGICERYDKVYEQLKNSNGKIDWKQGRDILSSVSQHNYITTKWSTVYDLKNRKIYLFTNNDYSTVREFSFNK